LSEIIWLPFGNIVSENNLLVILATDLICTVSLELQWHNLWHSFSATLKNV